MVNKVVPKEKLLDQAREWAESIAWSAPLAMQSVKEVQRAIECVPLEAAFNKMRTENLPVYRKMLKSDDAAEGVAAFCLLYTSPSPRDKRQSRMPSSA